MQCKGGVGTPSGQTHVMLNIRIVMTPEIKAVATFTCTASGAFVSDCNFGAPPDE